MSIPDDHHDHNLDYAAYEGAGAAREQNRELSYCGHDYLGHKEET